MASFRSRNGRWQARVSRKGHPAEARSFHTRQDAERWARSVELGMDRGTYIGRAEADTTTLSEVIARYMAEVLPGKRGQADDRIRLAALHRHAVCRLSLSSLTPARVAAFRDERLQVVKSGTVIRELAYLSAIINHARREWGICCANPVALVKKPPAPQGRDRVLSPEERSRLLLALAPLGRRSAWMRPLVTLALETAMRRGELLALRWECVDLQRRVAHLPITKNGERRTVPLSVAAMAVLSAIPRSLCGRVFPVSAAGVDKAFARALERAKVEGFRFHDLRHTAITQMATKLPNLIELSAVTGHKSIKMLARYYHPRAEDLAAKLG